MNLVEFLFLSERMSECVFGVHFRPPPIGITILPVSAVKQCSNLKIEIQAGQYNLSSGLISQGECRHSRCEVHELREPGDIKTG